MAEQHRVGDAAEEGGADQRPQHGDGGVGAAVGRGVEGGGDQPDRAERDRHEVEDGRELGRALGGRQLLWRRARG